MWKGVKFLVCSGNSSCEGDIIPFLNGLLLVREDPPPVERGEGLWDTKLQRGNCQCRIGKVGCVVGSWIRKE